MCYYWHFAIRETFKRAMRDGALDGVALPHQRPVTWFARDASWAPTVLNWQGGALRARSESDAVSEGLYRFGAPASILLTGQELRRKARISNAEWKSLCVAVSAQAADARLWFGHVGPLCLFDLIIDRFTDGQWVRLKRMRRVRSVGFVILHEAPVGAEDRF